MDKFWSIMTMPLGVLLCFGPAMLVWWLTRDRSSGNDKPGAP
jgi:inner membrane protein involved in colicin E2 resistance